METRANNSRKQGEGLFREQIKYPKNKETREDRVGPQSNESAKNTPLGRWKRWPSKPTSNLLLRFRVTVN